MRNTFWIIATTLVCLLGVLFFMKQSCSMRWADSGMRWKYSHLSGCLVETKTGIWVPEESYHELGWEKGDK